MAGLNYKFSCQKWHAKNSKTRLNPVNFSSFWRELFFEKKRSGNSFFLLFFEKKVKKSKLKQKKMPSKLGKILKKKSYSYTLFPSLHDFNSIHLQIPKHLGTNTSLRYLHLSCRLAGQLEGFPETLFQSLETNITLETLSLSSISFSTKSLHALNRTFSHFNNTLTSLYFKLNFNANEHQHSLIFSTFAEILTCNTSLTSLSYCDEFSKLQPLPSKDKIIDVLCQSNTSLLSLQLPTSPLRYSSIIKLLQTNTTLQTLSFYNKSDYVGSAQSFLEDLHNLPTPSPLTFLNLNGDFFEINEMVTLMSAVNISLPSLTSLSLRCTRSKEDTGANDIIPTIFFDLLACNTVLTDLSITSYWTFQPKSLDDLCHFIATHPTMVSLKLPLKLGVFTAGVALNNAYRQSPSLLSLSLSNFDHLFDPTTLAKKHNHKMKTLTLFQSLFTRLSKFASRSRLSKKVVSLS